MKKTILFWVQGIRFYIAIGIILVSVETAWWAWATYGRGSLASMRIEETYAWIAVVLLVLALLIGPLTKALPRLPSKNLLFDARRLLGVGAAWFACLHASIAYAAQFKFSNPINLPSLYRYSFLIAILALLVLLAMALTSFDAAQRFLGRWWFRLHRLVYAAAFLSLLHLFMIGTHAGDPLALALLSVAAVAIIGLHIFTVVRNRRPTFWQIVTVSMSLVLALVILWYGFGKLGQFK